MSRVEAIQIDCGGVLVTVGLILAWPFSRAWFRLRGRTNGRFDFAAGRIEGLQCRARTHAGCALPLRGAEVRLTVGACGCGGPAAKELAAAARPPTWGVTTRECSNDATELSASGTTSRPQLVKLLRALLELCAPARGGGQAGVLNTRVPGGGY